MPVPESTTTTPFVWLNHQQLNTTFCGIEHRLSSAAAPIHQFRGIKFANIPARFRQSTICNSYPSVTHATTHGPICPQKRFKHLAEETIFGIPPNPAEPELPQDEFECLNLNITCPGGLPQHSRIPVMIWFHGGGDHGSGSEWFFDAGAIVRKSIEYKKPVIVVTINFRIGLLGFATNALIRDDNRAAGEKGTGNYGLRDQRTAMDWVSRYIADFGGDPNNVTLFGIGTGAADIVLHLLSRANDEEPPLFHRAIVQSAIFEPVLPDVGSATWTLSRVMSALQITSVEKFRAIEVEKLLGLGQNIRAVDDHVFLRDGWQSYFGTDPSPSGKHRGHEHHRFAERPSRVQSPALSASSSTSSHLRPPLRHAVSGSPNRSVFAHSPKSRSRSTRRSVPNSGRRIILSADPSRQPLIIGDNSCDGSLWSLPISAWTSSGVVRRLKAICQNLSKATGLLRAYDISASTPAEDIIDHVLELVGDGRVAWPTHCLAESMKRDRSGKNVWRYVFDQEGPTRCVPHHGADLMYLFDTFPLPERAFSGAAAETYSFDVDDEDDGLLTSALNGTVPTPPRIDVAAVRGLSASAVIQKCERLQEQCGHMTSDEEDWLTATVDELTYTRVRDTMQERWLSFAYAEVPWREDRVFVFGPEGETGERTDAIFEGRRRTRMWKDVLEPLGAHLVQKCSVELSRGPVLGADWN